MNKKITAKAVKITSMTLGLMFGTMIAGAGIATAGWWYADRLNVAGLLGKSADINVVGGAKKNNCKNDAKTGQASVAINNYTDADGTMHSQTLECQQAPAAYDGWVISNQYGEWIPAINSDNIPRKLIQTKKSTGVAYEAKGNLMDAYGASGFGENFWILKEDKVIGVDPKIAAAAKAAAAAKEKAAQVQVKTTPTKSTTKTPAANRYETR